MKETNNLRESLAKYAHQAWAGWMEYLFAKSIYHEGCIKCNSDKGEYIIPRWAVERWKRQMNTPYEELSEEEKQSDREEADRMIEIMKGDV